MTIFFGLEFDDQVYPSATEQPTTVYLGPKRLLQWLETQFGLVGYANNNDYLRVEQYRQAIVLHLKETPTPFYKKSFEADPFGTATTLLAWRDELVCLSTYDAEEKKWISFFQFPKKNSPIRLQVLWEIDVFFKQKQNYLSFGYADRVAQVMDYLQKYPIENVEISFNEPVELLPNYIQLLLEKLDKKSFNALKNKAHLSPTLSASDLGKFQAALQGTKGEQLVTADGSLLLLHSKRETDAAAFLAKILAQNRDFKPVCFIPEKSLTLDQALVQEGLPSMGLSSSSSARPILQLLKLVTTFLWNPIDPYKILEFVSMQVKPLENRLAAAIAQQIAQRPGLQGEGWQTMMRIYFEELDERIANETTQLKRADVEAQYAFWFDRRRYDMGRPAPKAPMIEIFEYLGKWAHQKYSDDTNKLSSLLVLAEQADRVRELLEILPESYLSQLELERVVRTIYEPSPVVFEATAVQHLPYIHRNSALAVPTENLLWWNFTGGETSHFFSPWYKEEITFLAQKGIVLDTPVQKNQRQLWQRIQPVLQTTQRLILVEPRWIEGEEQEEHPLMGDLRATFDKQLSKIAFDLDCTADRERLETFFSTPLYNVHPAKGLAHAPAFLNFDKKDLDVRDRESLTSLENLVYFPYQWLFRYKSKLNNSAILSVAKDKTLMGNLAHRCFELMFRQDVSAWRKADIDDWLQRNFRPLLLREGATLMMYGKETEREMFLNRLRYAAWSLISMIQRNGWRIKASEQVLEGTFCDTPIKGIADLVLERHDKLAIVDLKWSGGTYRQNLLRNEEDLQLVLYSNLVTKGQGWATTAYFIIESGRMIARTTEAFAEAMPVSPTVSTDEVQTRIFERMKASYLWRKNQLAEGFLEIRTLRTKLALEDIYFKQQTNMDGLLEMKDEPLYDDYAVLIGNLE